MAPIADRLRTIRGGRDGAIAQLGERVVRNDEVGGSIPPGSTSLRSLRELRLGKHSKPIKREVSEGCLVVARRAKTGPASSSPLLPRKPRRPLFHKTCDAFAEIAAAQRHQHFA